jgi:hypothetical protein
MNIHMYMERRFVLEKTNPVILDEDIASFFGFNSDEEMAAVLAEFLKEGELQDMFAEELEEESHVAEDPVF